LIAERLAPAGRHQHKTISATRDMPDDLLLSASKAGRPKTVFRTDRAVAVMFRLKLNVESRIKMITRGFGVQLKQIES